MEGLFQTSGFLVSLAIALGLGLLVGLRREWVHKRMAGIRTFALVALLAHRSMLRPLLAAFGATAAGAVVLWIWWP